MENNRKNKANRPSKKLLLALTTVAVMLIFMLRISAHSGATKLEAVEPELVTKAKRDSVKSVQAFEKV